MHGAPTDTAGAEAQGLPSILRAARRQRGWSQLDLSERIGVSQRHLSFVEVGRARPSRALLLRWLHTLELPLGARNEALLRAGYAPAFGATHADDPVLSTAMGALAQLLSAHDPQPAVVLDAEWNVIQINAAAAWLLSALTPALPPPGATGEAAATNLLDLLARPDGMLRCIANLDEIGPAWLAHLHLAAAGRPAVRQRVDAIEGLLAARIGAHRLRDLSPAGAPMLTTEFTTSVGRIRLFSMFTTFGTPQDITLASLRVEHMFAADPRSLELLRLHAGGVSAGAQALNAPAPWSERHAPPGPSTRS